MNKVGFLVLGLAGAGVSLLALSNIRSGDQWPLSRSAPDDAMSVSPAEQLRPRDQASREFASPRRLVAGQTLGNARREQPDTGERGTGASREAEVTVADGSRHSAGGALRPTSFRSRGGRRDELIDRLASKGTGGVAVDESQAGAPGRSTAGSGAAKRDHGAVDLADASAGQSAQPDERDSELILSLPLAGNTQAEGPSQPVAEANLKIDQETGEIEFPENSVLEFPDAASIIQPEAGTLSLDIVPNWDGTDPGDSTFVQVKRPGDWQGTFVLFRNGRYLRLLTFDQDAQENDLGVDIGHWKAGERHSVTATWGEALLSIYIDGQLAGQRAYAGEINIPPGTPMYVGSNPGSVMVPGARAMLSNLRVYGHVLASDEIAGGVMGASAPSKPSS